MAARLTDKQKKGIIASYVELGSYNAVSKLFGISATTVKKVVLRDAECVKKCEDKKAQNTKDILAHMEEKRDKVCDIIDLYLDELLKIENFRNLSPSQLTTALGTLIDKFTMFTSAAPDGNAEDGLSSSLREMAEELESDDL